jgi:hypothetical protein
MLNEAMIIGVLLLIVFGAASVYLYSYTMYLEKKVSMMESLVVDMRMAVDSLMTEDHVHQASIPITGGPTVQAVMPEATREVTTGVAAAPTASEESFYSSVLEEAHELGANGANAPQEQGISLEAAMEGFKETEMAAVAPATIPVADLTTPPIVTSQKVEPNYDAMTRAELIAIGEQRGLRIKKSMTRNEILSVLRRSPPIQNQLIETGSEDASSSSAATGSVFPAGASLDGDFPVDLGQNGASLEEDTKL